MSRRLHALCYKSRIIDESAPNCHRLISLCAPASYSLAPQNPSQLHNNCSVINKHCWPSYASIWPKTARNNTRREYSSLVTTSARQCITCYGRDGTIASRSINTEGGSAALALTRKQKVIARPSVNSFQQGVPGFQVRILLTLAVTAAVTLFDQLLA